MKKKGILKRLTAIVLGVCMLTVTCFYGAGLQANAADPVLLKNSPEADFTKYTLGDFEIADGGLNTIGSTTRNLGGTIDKTLFQAKMYFPSSGFNNVYWGGEGWNGIAFAGDGEKLFIYVVGTDAYGEKVITSDMAGVQLYENDSLNFAISTEFINKNGEKADLKIGLWFNGVLCEGEYLTVEDVITAEFSKHLHTELTNDASLKGYSIYPPTNLEGAPEADFTKYTLRDFEIADGGLNTIGSTTKNLGGTIDKTLFQAKMYFPSSGFNNVYWGGEGWNGIAFAGDGEKLFIYVVGTDAYGEKVITSDMAGVQLYENDSLNFAISTEFINKNGEKADLKIGFWFNGVLCEGEYLTVEDVIMAEFAKHLHTELANDASLKGYSIPATGGEPGTPGPVQTQQILLSDIGIADGSYDSGAYGEREEGFKDTKLTFNAKAVGQYVPRIHFGTWNADDRTGINILFYGESLVVGNDGVDPNAVNKLDYTRTEVLASDFGLTSFLNTDIEYELNTEYIANDADEVVNDIRFTLLINGEQAVQVVIKDQIDKFGKGIFFCDGTITLGTPEELLPPEDQELTPDPVDTEEIILSDIGIQDGVYNSGAFGQREKGFKNTSLAFHAKMVGQYTPRIHFGTWSEEDRTGINILFYGESLVVGNDGVDPNAANKLDYTRTEILASDFGLTSFLNEEIEYVLKTEYVAVHQDGEVNDIRFTLMINGKQAVQVVIKDQIEKFGTGIFFCDGTITLGTPEELLPPDPLDDMPVADSYEKLTLRDYLLENINASNGAQFDRTYDNQSLNGTAFGAKMKFGKDSNGTAAFYIGGDAWCGIRLEVTADGSLGVSHLATDGTQTWIASVSPQDVGMKTFLGVEFELQMTFDVYKKSAGKADCKVGLYINGVFYNNKHLKLRDVEQSTLMTKVFVYGGTQGGLKMRSTYTIVDLSIWGLDRNWRKTLGLS